MALQNTAEFLVETHQTFKKYVRSGGISFADFVKCFCGIEGSSYSVAIEAGIFTFEFQDSSVLKIDEEKQIVQVV